MNVSSKLTGPTLETLSSEVSDATHEKFRIHPQDYIVQVGESHESFA